MKAVLAVLSLLLLCGSAMAQSVTLSWPTDPNSTDQEVPAKATVVIPADSGGVHYELIEVSAVVNSDCLHSGNVHHMMYDLTVVKTVSVHGTGTEQSKVYEGKVKRNYGGIFQDGGTYCGIYVQYFAVFKRTVNGGSLTYVGVNSVESGTNLGPTQSGAAGHIDPSFVWN